MVTSPTTSLEKTSLEAHVDLCAIRYQQLDTRLTVLESKMDAMQKEIIDGQKSMKGTIITAAGTIVSSLLAIVIMMAIKL